MSLQPEEHRHWNLQTKIKKTILHSPQDVFCPNGRKDRPEGGHSIEEEQDRDCVCVREGGQGLRSLEEQGPDSIHVSDVNNGLKQVKNEGLLFNYQESSSTFK